jgi:hypothetical integral membrane protein (TIGR02206 family)
MKPEEAFQAFSPAHLVVIFLTIAVPLGLAAVVRASGSRWLESVVSTSLAACLALNYLGAAIFLWHHHHLYWAEMLPFQLCDWAMFVIIVALINGRRSWFEIAYFWGIGGTLQAIITPNLPFGFPDFRFFSFFIAHSGIVTGVIFLMATRGYRPHIFSIMRTFAWSGLFCRHPVRGFCDWCELRILAPQTGNVFALELSFRMAASLSSPNAWACSAFSARFMFHLPLLICCRRTELDELLVKQLNSTPSSP